MKVLLLGKNGQVGWELNRTLLPLGDIVALDIEDLDLTCPKDIREKVRHIHPNIIVNGVAYTAVDKAEEDQETAMAVNGIAPGILAEEAKRCGASLVHYSTDYVFDGTKDEPYKEDDKPNPINFYGKSKLAGEEAIQNVGHPFFIFRTSWVYGLRGKNFLLTMMRLAKERDEIRVVNDQIGSPTWSRLVAEVTAQVLAKITFAGQYDKGAYAKLSGLYHLTSAGAGSWYDFTTRIVEKMAQDSLDKCNCKLANIIAIPTSEYPTPARRPLNSRMNCDLLKNTFSLSLPDWEKALDLVLT
jgi:dTDP-4-dehydrorhamnose reductase